MGSWWNGVRSQKKHLKTIWDIQRRRRRRWSGVSGSAAFLRMKIQFWVKGNNRVKKLGENVQIVNSPVSEQQCCTFPWFKSYSSGLSKSGTSWLSLQVQNDRCGFFSSSPWKTVRKSIQFFCFFSSLWFCLFSTSSTSVRCAPAETCGNHTECIQQTHAAAAAAAAAAPLSHRGA